MKARSFTISAFLASIVLLAVGLWLTPAAFRSSFAYLQSDADLSIVSQVTSPALPWVDYSGSLYKRPHIDPNLAKHEISFEDKCPNPPAHNPTGDGDGDKKNDDAQIDINGAAAGRAQTAPNGSVELWCIEEGDGDNVCYYYALLFDPVGPAGPRLIGKCPFCYGLNEGWKFINKRTGHIASVYWGAEDGGVDDDVDDDDDDGKLDEWWYVYDTITDTVDQVHVETDEAQEDSDLNTVPATKPFTFGDLLPLNPRNDDPTDPNDPPDFSENSNLAQEECCTCTGERPAIGQNQNVPLVIESYIANDGPVSSASGDASVTVEAPMGCTVDGTDIITKTHLSIPVSTAVIEMVTDTFTINCSVLGAHVFTLISSIEPTESTVTDPEPSDDRSIATFSVQVTGTIYLPIVMRNS